MKKETRMHATKMLRQSATLAVVLTLGAGFISCSDAGDSEVLQAESEAAVKEQAPHDAIRADNPQRNLPAAERVKNRYIVVFKKDTLRGSGKKEMTSKVAAISAAYRGKTHHIYHRTIEAMVVTIDDKAELERLKNDPRVDHVTPDSIVTLDSAQPDPTWGLDRIDQATGAPDSTYLYESTGDNVHVYVIDTGLYAEHEEFEGRVGNGWDFVESDADPQDCNSHGTHVSGTAVGTRYGVAKEAIVHPVRVFDCGANALASDIIAAVEWVTVNHIKPAVVNMSLSTENSEDIVNAVNASINEGIFYATSAGNGYGMDACDFAPGHIPAVMTVGAASEGDVIADLSNIGACVDIFAPGTGVVSAGIVDPTSTFVGNGTSMASPHVAGAAALLLSKNPTLTPAEVTQAILDSATPDALGGIVAPTPNLLLNTTAVNLYGTGMLHVDRDALSCGGAHALSLTDQNLTGTDFASVEVRTSTGDVETLTLARLTPSSDSLDGELITVGGTPVSGDGSIQVTQGTEVTISYEDADDTNGNATTISTTFVVDCTPPSMGAVTVNHVFSDGAQIEFDIDEAADVLLKYGTSCGSLTLSMESYAAVDPTHTMTLSGLAEGTPYYFSLTAVDRAGNTSAEDDNGGSCYTFTTATAVYFEDFESGSHDFDLTNGRWGVTDACSATKSGHSPSRALYLGDPSTCIFETAHKGSTTAHIGNVDFDKDPAISFNYLLDMGSPGYRGMGNGVRISLIIDGVTIDVTGSDIAKEPPLQIYYAERWIHVTIPIGEYASGVADVEIFINNYAAIDDPMYEGFFIDDLTISEATVGSSCEDIVYEAETMTHSTGGATGDGWNIWSNGYAAFNHVFEGGIQEMIVTAAGQYANGWPNMRVTVGDVQVYSTTVNSATWTDYAFTFNAPSGNAEVRVYFTNDFYQPPQDRNLLLDKVAVACSTAVDTLTANLDIFTVWESGFCARLAVTNNGTAPTSDWTVEVDTFTNSINNYWNTEPVSGTGRHIFRPASYDRVIGPGQTNSDVGFCTSGSVAPLAEIVSVVPVY